MVNTGAIDDAAENFINAILGAFETLFEIFAVKIGDFLGTFIAGDLTSNSPALLALTIVMIATGGVLAYKISKG